MNTDTSLGIVKKLYHNLNNYQGVLMVANLV